MKEEPFRVQISPSIGQSYVLVPSDPGWPPDPVLYNCVEGSSPQEGGRDFCKSHVVENRGLFLSKKERNEPPRESD